MTSFLKIIIPALILLAFSCKSQNPKPGPLIPKDLTNKNEKENTLFVFVGEKIDYKPIPSKPGDFDNGIKAKYKIIQRVYGDYQSDIIEFEAYDHYGTPQFTKYKNALLFVSKFKGKYYQEKYMYDAVFKTRNGRWAGPYSDEYDHPYNKNTSVKPEIIDFAEEVSFPTKFIDQDGKVLELSYPEPYFKTIGEKAIAIYGNYIEELFKLRKEGVLTARELFGDKEAKEAELEKNRDSTTEDY